MFDNDARISKRSIIPTTVKEIVHYIYSRVFYVVVVVVVLKFFNCVQISSL